jgi:hypothetical protein
MLGDRITRALRVLRVLERCRIKGDREGTRAAEAQLAALDAEGRKRLRSHYYKAVGLCLDCGERPAPSHARCAACVVKFNAKTEALKAAARGASSCDT